MTIAARGAAIAGGVLAAAIVLVVLAFCDDKSPLEYFASQWKTSAFMSHASCACALQPGGQCFRGDWEAMITNGTAVGYLGETNSSLDLTRTHVCTGTPAIVSGCVRVDQHKGAKHYPSADSSRHAINAAFVDLFDDTLDGCDGDLRDISVDEQQSKLHDFAAKLGDLVKRHHDGHHRGATRDIEHALRRLQRERATAAGEQVQGGEAVRATTRHVTLFWDAPHGNLRSLRSVPGLDMLLPPADEDRVVDDTVIASQSVQDDLDDEDEHEDEDRSLRGGDKNKRDLDLMPIDTFLDEFGSWQDGDRPIEMEISGPGWRRCMRRFVWKLRKRQVCSIGYKVVQWGRGFSSVHLYTKDVVPEFDFLDAEDAPGVGQFVLQAGGRTLWQVAPSDESTTARIVSRVGDLVYIPSGWSASATCQTRRCVSMLV